MKIRMFKKYKPKNEIVKKDFFAKTEKTVSVFDYASIVQNAKFKQFYTVNKLNEISELPIKDEYFIITTLKASPTSDILINVDSENVYLSANAAKKNYIDILIKKGLKSVVFRKTMKEDFSAILKDLGYKGDVFFKDNHTKIIAFQIHDNYYVLQGSGNPSINARNEMYVLINSLDIFEEVKKLHSHA